jgi:hypothetical protein
MSRILDFFAAQYNKYTSKNQTMTQARVKGQPAGTKLAKSFAKAASRGPRGY